MNEKQIVEAIRKLMAQHKGSEKALYEELCSEADGWSMRLEELEAEEEE